jgi:hypothetical protein
MLGPLCALVDFFIDPHAHARSLATAIASKDRSWHFATALNASSGRLDSQALFVRHAFQQSPLDPFVFNDAQHQPAGFNR